jgi:hypothetical protein
MLGRSRRAAFHERSQRKPCGDATHSNLIQNWFEEVKAELLSIVVFERSS